MIMLYHVYKTTHSINNENSKMLFFIHKTFLSISLNKNEKLTKDFKHFF